MTSTPTLASVHAYVTRRHRARTIADSTAESQRNILHNFALAMGNRRPENIGRSDIERWLTSIAHRAPGTRRARYAVVNTYLEDCVDRETIRRNPMRKIPPPKIPKSRHRNLTGEQVAAILRACVDELALAYVVLGFQCGFRRAEVAGIEIGDLTWGERASVTVTGKGGHARTVPFPAEAQTAVERYLRANPCNGGPLFRQRRFPTKGVTADWIGEDFVKIAYAAGVKHTARDGVSFHAARHTALTDIYRACKDALLVQEVAGHSSLKTTQGYLAGADLTAMAAAMAGRTYAA